MKNILGHTAVIVFAINIAGGLLQFLGQSYLHSQLSPESFSQTTLVLSLFSSYMLLIELGLQGELIRKFGTTVDDDKRNDLFAASLVVRMCGAVLAVLGLVIHGLVAGVSAVTLFAMASFGLSFLPAAVLLGFESLGFALQKPFLASALRLSRCVALVCFFALVGAFSDDALKFFPSFFVVFLLCAVILFQIVGIEKSKMSRREIFASARVLFRDMRPLTAGFLVWWIFGTLYSIICVKTLGETGLSEFNIAQTLAIPLAMLTQAIMQNWIAQGAKENDGKPKFSFSKFGFMIAVTVLYCAAFAIPGVVDMLYSGADLANVFTYFLPLAFAQCLAAIFGFVVVACKAYGDSRAAIISPLIAVSLMLISWYLLVDLTGPAGLGLLMLIGHMGSTCYVVKAYHDITYAHSLAQNSTH